MNDVMSGRRPAIEVVLLSEGVNASGFTKDRAVSTLFQGRTFRLQINILGV